MSKHTPGPWRIGLPPLNNGLTISARQGLIVAFATSGWDVPTRANARLIAAAPELLEFVEEWLSAQGSDANYMTEKARAAIAKATGGNQ